MSFKDRVREEMKFQGLTAKELAAKANISVNTLNLYIGYREAMPSAEAGLKIANALSVSLNYLMYGENDISSDNTEKLTLQKEILSITNTMTQTQLENFLQVTKLFAATSAK